MIRGEKIWIRIHPSIFEEAFAAIRSVGVVRDLRGELDSFELVGPMSADVLSRVLRPVKTLNFGPDVSNGIYAFTIYDPRLQ
jgi:ribonuclease P/MRP protein subunit POP1